GFVKGHSFSQATSSHQIEVGFCPWGIQKNGNCVTNRGLCGDRSRSAADSGTNNRSEWSGIEKRNGLARGPRSLGCLRTLRSRGPRRQTSGQQALARR